MYEEPNDVRYSTQEPSSSNRNPLGSNRLPCKENLHTLSDGGDCCIQQTVPKTLSTLVRWQGLQMTVLQVQLRCVSLFFC